MREFLKRKQVIISFHTYFITALSYMALGLFSSLIIGLIMKTVGEQAVHFGVTQLNFLTEMGSFAMETKIMGGAIGIAFAYGLKATTLVMFFNLFVGTIGVELVCLV